VPKDLTPEKALIFRIVHRDNMPTVWKDGCHCRSTTQGKKYVEIGNQELIARRKGRAIPCGPGGTLSDYVPFYFTPYSPMLYNIETGYNGIPKKPLQDIVILVSSLHLLKKQGVPFVFSDRHAYLKRSLARSRLMKPTSAERAATGTSTNGVSARVRQV
jgi:ssDNA thymidine ADP-ribosyltransferase, DarT